MTDAHASLTPDQTDTPPRIRWRFSAHDSFAHLAHRHRLPLIHSLPGILVWPFLLLALGAIFGGLGQLTWLLSGAAAAPFSISTAQFAAVTLAYALLATLMWHTFQRYDAHHRAFSILPSGPGDVLIALAVLIFVLQVGSPLTILVHDYAMADPSATLAGGATREEVSNVDNFTAVGAAGWSIVLLTVIAAPIVEEILFRGWMLPMMLARGVPAFFAILISALAFGLIHTPQGLMVVISTFFLGVALGAARVLTGRVAAPVLGHMANNAWAVLIVPRLIEMQAG